MRHLPLPAQHSALSNTCCYIVQIEVSCRHQLSFMFSFEYDIDLGLGNSLLSENLTT